jgi:Fe(3+) dicitrate transport protein
MPSNVPSCVTALALALLPRVVSAQNRPADEAPDAPVTPGDGATVLGRRYAGPDALGGSGHRVTEEEMRALDYADPDRVMVRIPGVYVRSEDGYGLRPNIGMRGANSHRSRRITLLEDGVLQLYAPYSSPSTFSLTPMTRVVGIDVYRGPSAILFGPQTIAGAIDLRTRDVPERPEAAVDLVYGNFDTSRVHFYAGTSNARFGALVEGLYYRSSGFQRIDFTGGSNGFELGDFAMRAFWRGPVGAHVRHRLSVKLVYQFERSNETYLGLTDADFRASPYRRYVAGALDEFNRHRTQVEVREQFDFGTSGRLTVVAYRSDVARVWYRLDRFRVGPSINSVLINPRSADNASYYDLLRGVSDTPGSDQSFIYVNNDWRYVSQGVQADARYQSRRGLLGHDVRAGVRVHNDSIDRHIGADGWRVQAGRLLPDRLPRLSQNEDLAATTAFSGYAQYALSLGPVTLAPGARVEWMSMNFTDRLSGRATGVERTALLPGGAVTYDPNERVRVFAGVHRGFSPPLPQDASAINVETSTNYEVGGRVIGLHDLRVELAGFYSDYDNMTSQCTLTAGCTDVDRAFNSGRVLVWGAEAAAGYTFRAARLSFPVQAAYTYTGSSFQSAFASADPQLGVVHVGDRLPYVPEHQVSVSAGVEMRRRWGVSLQGTYVGEMREEASQGDAGRRTDAQWLLDLMASWRPLERVTVFVRGENLLFQTPVVSRRPWGARPGRPFQAQLGIRIEL